MNIPYSIFNKAADHLVNEYKMRLSGKTRPDKPILPVKVLLFATLEGFATIPSPFIKQEALPGLVLSHLEDKVGIIPECKDQLISIRAPPTLTQLQLFPGDRLMIHVLMVIKPHAELGSEFWVINYHQNVGSHRLGFQEVIYLEKVEEKKNAL
jgi:hypothetical protein